ncbi:MAG: hypothetical protein KGJ86_22740, partial [Chloroflexota bacterium]|nr:hypothetical protein [Chloroflexota bacterium]
AKGTLRSFDAGSYTATVQLDGSLFVYLPGIPVNRGIGAAVMIAGASVALAVFDANNPADAMVVGVW